MMSMQNANGSGDSANETPLPKVVITNLQLQASTTQQNTTALESEFKEAFVLNRLLRFLSVAAEFLKATLFLGHEPIYDVV